VLGTTELDEVNAIVGKINMLEDSKHFQSSEKRIELMDRQMPLWKELYAKVGKIISPW
jgi:hypothetical protein